MKRLAKQAKGTVRSRKRRTGIMGCLALDSHQINPTKARIERGSVVSGREYVQGTELPPALSPRSNSTKNVVVKKTPRDVGLVGLLTWNPHQHPNSRDQQQRRRDLDQKSKSPAKNSVFLECTADHSSKHGACAIPQVRNALHDASFTQRR
jgi:hypothetical protein